MLDFPLVFDSIRESRPALSPSVRVSKGGAFWAFVAAEPTREGIAGAEDESVDVAAGFSEDSKRLKRWLKGVSPPMRTKNIKAKVIIGGGSALQIGPVVHEF